MGKIQVRNKLFLIPILLIIPFLALFLYLYISGINPSSIYTLVTGKVPNSVKYETFDIYIDENIPENISQDIESKLSEVIFNEIPRFNITTSNKADYIISQTDNSDYPIYKQTYLPVGHLYWINSNTSLEDISNNKVYVDSQISNTDLELLKNKLGNKNIIKQEDLLETLKQSEDNIGLIKIENLTKEYKLLNINNQNYLNDNSSSINVTYGLTSAKENLTFVSNIINRNIQTEISQDLDTNNIVKINMTGVTAITRGLASKIDSANNFSYPSQNIGEFLADADLTHVSNEISFKEGCASYSGMRFCSRPEYIQALKDSGVDIVELTGNHNNDFGSTYNTNTINMYKELGWDYFGGGLNSEDASKILYKEVKGNTIAFIGYNYYDTMLNSGAIASSTRAGANSYSESKMESNIKEAKENADVVIVDFQFQECYSYPSSDVIYPICYKPLSSPDQKGVFRKAVDFGADIVIGAQAHQPQTYESYNGSTIFYGLGNLYFDQVRWIGTRQGLVVSIYISEGEVIQTELTPTIYESDMITRVAKPDESDLLLELLKSARTF